jgi:uncharacterized membrane protein YvbJ
MLICNNCGCVHHQQVTVCTQCRIPGNFTVKPDQERGAPAIGSVVCINCGNHIGADLNRCPECRFPQDKPNRQLQANHRNNSPFTRNLKTG